MLFTTFTRNLATDIRANLTKICSPEELQRIEVIHLDGWVMNFLKGQGLQVRVFNDEARDSCWSLAMDVADTSLGLDERFYREEWKDVVLAQGCRSRDDYLMARRVGRGTRLSRPQRAQIWPVFDAVRAEFRQRGLWEPEEAKQIAADLLHKADQGRRSTPPWWWMRPRILTSPPSRCCGPWWASPMPTICSSSAIPTSASTASRWCSAAAASTSAAAPASCASTTAPPRKPAPGPPPCSHGLDFDDLDGGSDPGSDYRSLLHGDKPVVQGFEDPAEEQRFLGSTLRQLREERGNLASTCVAPRTNTARDRVALALEKARVLRPADQRR